MKKIEHSKLITIGVGFLVLWVMVLSTIASATGDSSPLVYLIPSVFGLAGVVVGFYFNKAKSENMIKIMKSHDIPITEENLKEALKGDDYHG